MATPIGLVCSTSTTDRNATKVQSTIRRSQIRPPCRGRQFDRIAMSTLACRLLAGCRFARRYAPIEPIGDHSGDFKIVLFQHQEVAIAADADVGKSDKVNRYAGLFQESSVAMSSRCAEGRFGR